MARGAPEPAQARTDFQWQGGSRVPPVVPDSPEGPYLVSHSPVALPRLAGPLPGARLGTFAFAAGEIQVLTVVSIRVNPDGSPRYAGNPVTLTISGEMVFMGFPPALRSLTLLTDGLGQVHFNILFVRGSEALGAATAIIDAPPDYHVEIKGTIIEVRDIFASVKDPPGPYEVCEDIPINVIVKPAEAGPLVSVSVDRTDGVEFGVPNVGTTESSITVRLSPKGTYALMARYFVSSKQSQVEVAGDPDFVLVTPDPGVIVAGDTREFKAIGFCFTKESGKVVPPPRTDPVRDIAALAKYRSTGPTPVTWTRDPPAEAGKATGAERPDLAFVGPTVGPSVKVKATGQGGVLRPGLVATPPKGAADPETRIIVPFIQNVVVTEPTEAPIVVGELDTARARAAATDEVIKVEPGSLDVDRAGANPALVLFAERRTPGDPVIHDTVIVTAFVGPEAEDLTVIDVKFQSFDVDDWDNAPNHPMEPGIDDETIAEDNKPLTVTPFPLIAGGFLVNPRNRDAMVPTQIVRIAGAKKNEAKVTFRTSMTPGDNYRVVATLRPSMLAKIEARQDDGQESRLRFKDTNADVTLSHLPPPSARETKGETLKRERPSTRTSPIITVWRTLHIEIDTMGSEGMIEQQIAAKAYFNGKITERLFADSVIFETNLPRPGENSPEEASLKEGRFEKVNAQGHVTRSFAVRNVEWQGNTTARVTLDVGRGAGIANGDEGTDWVLRDDDRLTGLLPARIEDIAVAPYFDPTAPFDRVRSALAHVFLVAKFDGAGEKDNTNNDLAFGAQLPLQIHFPPNTLDDPDKEKVAAALGRDMARLFKQHWASNNLNRTDEFFVGYVLLAYQGQKGGECDPNSTSENATLGQNPPPTTFGLGNVGGNVLYLESSFDSAVRSGQYSDPRDVFPRALIHEIGHWFGLSDNDKKGDRVDEMTGRPFGPHIMTYTSVLRSQRERVFRPGDRRLVRRFRPSTYHVTLDTYIARATAAIGGP